MTVGAIFAVTGEGSFLQSREALLVSFLLGLGYKIAGPQCYQDVTNVETGRRRFIFQFGGSLKIRFAEGKALKVAEAAALIRGTEPARESEIEELRRYYHQFPETTTTPVKDLRKICSDPRWIEVYQNLLKEIEPLKKHIEIRQGRRTFFLYADMTPEEQRREMQRLTS